MQRFQALPHVTQVLVCGVCQQEHLTDQCPLVAEQANFVGNAGRQINQQGNYQAGGWNRNQYNNPAGGQWNQGGSAPNQYNRGPPGFGQTTQQRQGNTSFMIMESMLSKVLEGQSHILTEVQ